MSGVLDRQPSGNAGCFNVCLNQDEDPNQDFLKIQSNQISALSTEDQKKKMEIDNLLSEAMNELTFEERQHQQEVLHGVEDHITEEDTFIDSVLQELDFLLLRSKLGSVYETAERMDPKYVKSRPFRLMFLRCNQYDGKAAADQMLQFFKVKRELFGVEKLVREITMEDLDEDDRASLETGFLQLVGKDRSKRVVYILVPGLRAFKELRNELRGRFYFMMKMLQPDEDTQRRGAVTIAYSVGQFRDSQNGTGYFEHAQLINAIPLKHAAVHLCLDDVSEYLLFNLGIKILPAKLRSRCRSHFGSHLECQYRLSTFGVSKMLLPIDASSGAIDLDRHKRWFQSCFPESESAGSVKPQSLSIVTKPTVDDVLYDGKSHHYHRGNQQLRTLVLEWSGVYDSGDKVTKRTVVNSVIDKIEKSGGRFLKSEHRIGGVSWSPVPREELRRKIAQMFRNRRRRLDKVAHTEGSR